MADFDDLEEFCDEAGAALEDGTPVLDFRVTRGTDLSFSIIEAFQAVIQLVASMPGDAEVPCLFGSQRALEMAERYQAGGEAADTVLQAGGHQSRRAPRRHHADARGRHRQRVQYAAPPWERRLRRD